MLQILEHSEFPNCCAGTPAPAGGHALGNLVLAGQRGEEGPGRLRIPVRLKRDVGHGAAPVFALYSQCFTPPTFTQTPSDFLVAEYLSGQGSEHDVPLPQGLGTDGAPTPVPHLQDVSPDEGEAVVPDSMRPWGNVDGTAPDRSRRTTLLA